MPRNLRNFTCLLTHLRRKHVLGDLQPYVCTYSDCDLSDQFFKTREEWYKHEIQWHRIEWFCNVDSHPHFAEQTGFLAHMKSDHNTTFDPSHFSLLSSMFRCPSRSAKGDCNLCLKSSVRVENHVSRHLEQVALFALPRVSNLAGDETAHDNDSVGQDILQYEIKHHKQNHSDSQDEHPSPTDIHEQQSDGSEFYQDIIPDSEDLSWDRIPSVYIRGKSTMPENVWIIDANNASMFDRAFIDQT